jgi:hypothetical protein
MRPSLSSRISARRLLRLITLSLLAGLSAARHGAAQILVECRLAVSLDYQEVPADVCPQVQFEPPPRHFDALAWQSFKMLVWPAAPVGRGHADEHKTITDSGKPTFETYKADWETFLPLAATPADWNSYAISHNPCRNNPMIAAGDLVLASQSEFGNTCMGCHNAARTSDFIWSIPLNVNIPATMQGKPSPRTLGLQTLQSIVGTNVAQ